jgi:hypothetical protein
MAGMGYVKDRWIEAMQPTAQDWERRWIAVSERMPEKHTAVLVHTDMDGNHAASFDGEEWFCDYGGAWLFPNVTHWMPLPPAPPKAK